MSVLSRHQWNCALDKAVKEGFLSNLNAEELLPHLRQGGLSLAEEELILNEKAGHAKMSKLERFLRVRPRLLASLRSGLLEMDHPFLAVFDDAVDEVQKNQEKLDNQFRFRCALRQHEVEISVLAEWAVPRLREADCLTPTEEEEVRSGRRLIDILLRKSQRRCACLMKFLETEQVDLFFFLKDAAGTDCQTELETTPTPDMDAGDSKRIHGPISSPAPTMRTDQEKSVQVTPTGDSSAETVERLRARKKAFSQQIPNVRSWPVVLVDSSRGRLRHVWTELELPADASVGHVRASAAVKLGCATARLRLQRRVARGLGGELAQVCNARGDFPSSCVEWEFGDAAGEVWAKADVEAVEVRNLDDDEEAFLLVCGRTNLVLTLPK